MAALLYANNAAGTLAVGITNASTTLTLNAGQAALFPNPIPPQVFYATLADAATQTLIEIVKCTAVAGNIISIVRAQDGTTALSWSAGDIFSQRTIRLELQGFENAAEGQFGIGGNNVAIIPSTTLGIQGTTSADNANPGAVGEVLSATGTSGLASGVVGGLASVTLTPGDWDVWGSINYITPVGVTPLVLYAAVGPVATSLPSPNEYTQLAVSFTPSSGQVMASPHVRFNVSTNTTVFAIASAAFTGGSAMTAQGFISARRTR